MPLFRPGRSPPVLGDRYNDKTETASCFWPWGESNPCSIPWRPRPRFWARTWLAAEAAPAKTTSPPGPPRKS